MKKIICLALVLICLCATLIACDNPFDPPVCYKPVIYLYPTEKTDVRVTLTLDGELTTTYPKYNGAWEVTATPDGTLEADGVEYNYLYWEGSTTFECDFSTGYCVKGQDTAEFLEWALAEQGLNRREANEFIIYWLPQMEQNQYNVISFQTSNYTDAAKLDVSPTPDTVIRVFMSWYPSENEVNIQPQLFDMPQRQGFTLVEWGGTQNAD